MINSGGRKTPFSIKLLIVLSIMLLLLCTAYYINIIKKDSAPLAEIAEELPVTYDAPVEVPIIKAEAPIPLEPEPAVKEPLKEILDLRKEYSNDDIIGYLEIEGTNISYPVAQADDNEFYLTRDLYGKDSVYGAIFMDYENSIEELSDNTVIYGHNMRDGSMFHNMRYYFEKEYYNEHPYITFTTLYDKTLWEIFSFYETSTDFYYIQTSFDDKNSFYELLLLMKVKSVYDTGVSVNKNNKIVTLSTCANEGGEKRYVLNAKLIDG